MMTRQHIRTRLHHLRAGVGRRGRAVTAPPIRGRRVAAVLALAALTALMQVGPTEAASPLDGGSAPPYPPAPAQSVPGPGRHGLGFVRNPAAPLSSRVHTAAPLSLPSAADLSPYNPPVGDQGNVGSCTAWATGYYLRGWYAKRDGYYPAGGSNGAGSFAPMYTYAQISRGHDNGSTFADNLNIQLQQGLDTRADYSQGDYDYTTQPTGAETTDAVSFKISSYGDVNNGGGTSLQTWIESSIASGNPVALSIPVYPNFDAATGHPENYFIDVPTPGTTSRGLHAVFASKYDANGLWIENSWGTNFGRSGYAELSWNFVNQYALEAVNVTPVAPSGFRGYVWASSPTASSYTPSLGYQFNSSGAINTITRSGVGAYTVSFPNIGIVTGGTVLVTAYGGGSETCKAASWGSLGTTLQVNVRCFNSAGAPADTLYTVSYTIVCRPPSTAPMAYLWANSPTAASYMPNLTYQFNSSGSFNTITRSGVGAYAVRLPSLGAVAGHVQVTAYGYGSERCKVASWGPSGADQMVQVRCFNSAGAPVDTYYTLTYASGTSISGGFSASSAYAWANQPSSASYTPNSLYQFNSSGAANTITRSGTGSYTVSMPGQNLGAGDVQVTAYGYGVESCKVAGWSPYSGVSVRCFDNTGAPADTYFDVAFLNS